MTVSKSVQQIIDTKSTTQVVIGQLGLDSLDTLEYLLTSQKIRHHKVTVKVFSPIDSVLINLINNKRLEQIAGEEALLPLVAIEGCQRRILNNGQVIIDFYLGPIIELLQKIPMVNDSFIDGWIVAGDINLNLFNDELLWQMGKISHDRTQVYLSQTITGSDKLKIEQLAQQSGLFQPNKLKNDDIAFQERAALRSQLKIKQAPFPIVAASAKSQNIAIIGGGIASASLALSLAERGQKVSLFCEDSALAQAASGNKQGAIYPLLTPDNNYLSQYFQQAYLFSLQRLKSLAALGHKIDFDLCGVVHTGHDERSRKRVAKIIDSHSWNSLIADKITAKQASEIASVKIDDEGIFYPLGGWVSPQDFTQAAFNQAKVLADVSLALNTKINTIDYQANGSFLTSDEQVYGPFSAVVVANGKSITQFNQTQYLQATGFRGQVSHAPSRAKLSKLSTVLCAHGYMTPSNNSLHCLGASYVKNAQHLNYCPTEQVENLKKIQHSYLEQDWVEDIDISGHSARVGVRMVTRDHAPMMGPAPDIDAILALYQTHQLTPASRQFWQSTVAPTHKDLYVLGGLGSRGLSSGPLAAEALAAQICAEDLPISLDFIALLSPNRMWLRKLLKGKALEVGSDS
ncbi:FAD-dependent 5-carboxymethylaminomethyl-2-thiouridine(34) oxidoreductase MnmC [Shewanella sp. 10N.261.52.F9]|uniref:FAD-dependent 5-carboxymethylaminomethyl-2-thiouridine(34) oxidoreductase MnmC n=1 Tax=Shewanella sp. 10N.261.52.F9 TaxID=3229684 RepID=UPI0035535687